MARVAINAIARPAGGYDVVTGADYTTLATGADNGVELTGARNVYLRNGTGGAAVFTIIVVQAPAYQRIGTTIPDVTITVAQNSVFSYVPTSAVINGARLLIDCDVAAEVLGIA